MIIKQPVSFICFLYLAKLMHKHEQSHIVCEQTLTEILNHFEREYIKLTPDFIKYIFLSNV